MKRKRSRLSTGIWVTLSSCLLVTLLTSGCSQNQESAGSPSDSSSPSQSASTGGPGGPGAGGPGQRGPGGPGGPGGPNGPGRRMEPVAATATAPQIYQQKCSGCHGDKGQGKRAPALTKLADRPNDQIRKTIHDGHERMPAFGNQMTDAQLDALVVYVKQLGSAKGAQ
ncbi:MAG: cytochrome c [Abitibacteriaceae bacterium]|nr:cytochrome c [Abditibacteriaceae bacterium]